MKKIKERISPYFLLSILIFAIGFGLRTYNINWDGRYYFHPDELHLYNVTSQLHLPDTWQAFWDTDSPLNPKFFAYGSLPLYLLKGTSHVVSLFGPELEQYSQLYAVGRLTSSLFDSLTILLVYVIATRIGLTMRWRLTAAAIYALAVFPIQNAHFYTVDTQLTFWAMCTLVLCLTAVHINRTWPLFLAAITTGLALSTKITAVLLVPIVLISLIFVCFAKHASWRRSALMAAGIGILLIGSMGAVTLVTQPYIAIDYHTFVRDVTQQLRMRADATIFPYTLQYINTKPYMYPMAQIIQWGLGPLVGILGFGGIGVLLIHIIAAVKKRAPTQNYTSLLLVLLVFFLFFIPLGSSAVKFMRYYLPLYPVLAITATYALYTLFQHIRLPFQLLFGSVVGGSYLFWIAAFMAIYTTPHPWIQASTWITTQIPPGSTLAIEHWDRGLPVWGMSMYDVEELELYRPDSSAKIDTLIQQLERSDYIIIASNRLHASIPRWPQRYPATIVYYEQLFSGQLGFEKVATFESYPQFLGVRINDARADESFTVYDHPQVLIFRKTTFDAGNAADMLRTRLTI